MLALLERERVSPTWLLLHCLSCTSRASIAFIILDSSTLVSGYEKPEDGPIAGRNLRAERATPEEAPALFPDRAVANSDMRTVLLGWRILRRSD